MRQVVRDKSEAEFVAAGAMEGPDDEAIEVFRGTGGRDFARAGGGRATADLYRKTDSARRGSLLGRRSSGLDVSEAKRLKSLEDENAKLKRLLANAMLDNLALKYLLKKNPEARREARVCRAARSRPTRCASGGRVKLSKRIARRSGTGPGDPQTPIYFIRLRALAAQQRWFGYRRLHVACAPTR
jgi:putative transposase